MDNRKGRNAGSLARENALAEAGLGSYLSEVESTLADLQSRNIPARIWRKDHTVWKPDPKEIAYRLGWLNVTDVMEKRVGELAHFAQEVKDAGYRHVVLLGMGGSSLGAETLRQAFGHASGYPELLVMDTTVPSWVQALAHAVDPARTLFVVSSKSGSTLETLTGYAYFRGLVEAAGRSQAGKSFVAITDPGTPLEKLAKEDGFRHVFLNPPDIGGRYSVLSYFGLAPAALAGMDVAALLKRTEGMKEGCAAVVDAHVNPGAWLGAVMGTLAIKGRNKLTLVTTPGIAGFGLWAEQLIAESLGKDGKGIVPVAGEPLLDPAHYGDDRLFVYLRLEKDDTASTDGAVERLRASGQPVVRLDLRGKLDLGAEFFRWEFAVAVAGSLLGVHPFDQPDVQSAKDRTAAVLDEYGRTSRLPQVEALGSLRELLGRAKPRDYLAVLAYLRPTHAMEQALAGLRKKVMERHRIATTAGYGPRYLHSTGQLHKGGPHTGLFLVLTESHSTDAGIPGQPYSFGVLADAQALGDVQALKALERRVAMARLGTDAAGDITKLAAAV